MINFLLILMSVTLMLTGCFGIKQCVLSNGSADAWSWGLSIVFYVSGVWVGSWV